MMGAKSAAGVVVCACCQQGYAACDCRAGFTGWSACPGKVESVSSWQRSRARQESEYLSALLEREGEAL